MRHFLLFPACLLATLLPLLASAAPAAGSPALAPCDDCLPGVRNFARVSAELWRGAQPDADGFRALEQAGARTVISLRIGEDSSDLPRLAGTRLRYVQIPMKAWWPSTASLARFLAEVGRAREEGRTPVFVHCQQGRDRTGYSVAAYRMAVQGWSADAAIAEMEAFHFNRIWIGNPPFLRQLDVPALRRQAGLAD